MKKTIEIGGQVRPVNFGTLFMYNFQEKHGQNPLAIIAESLGKIPKDIKDDEEAGTAFLNVFQFPFMVNVLTCALESGAEVNGISETYDRATICEWVDEAGGMVFLGSVMAMLFEALPKDKSSKDERPADTKKKRGNLTPID